MFFPFFFSGIVGSSEFKCSILFLLLQKWPRRAGSGRDVDADPIKLSTCASAVSLMLSVPGKGSGVCSRRLTLNRLRQGRGDERRSGSWGHLRFTTQPKVDQRPRAVARQHYPYRSRMQSRTKKKHKKNINHFQHHRLARSPSAAQAAAGRRHFPVAPVGPSYLPAIMFPAERRRCRQPPASRCVCTTNEKQCLCCSMFGPQSAANTFKHSQHNIFFFMYYFHVG